MIKAFFALFYFILCTTSIAQLSIRDSYRRSFPDNKSSLETGRLYQEYYLAAGHQFYESPLPVISSVNLNGIDIDSVMLNYDVYNNMVIYYKKLEDNTLLPLIPNQSLIRSFKMDGKKFIRLEDILGNQEARFYELIYSNTNSFIFGVKLKDLTLSPGASGKSEEFRTQEEKYLVIKDQAFPIKRANRLSKKLLSLDRGFKDIIQNSNLRKDYLIDDLKKILDKFNQ